MESSNRVALLIDADNINNSEDIRTVIEEINTNFGDIYIKRAYGDWTNPKFEHLKGFVLENAISLVTQLQYKDGKNSTDAAMIIDAMDILYTKSEIDTFCLVTGDSDFTKLAQRLKEEGKFVIGFGYSKSSQKYLISACNDYKYIDVINNELPDNANSSDSITPIEDIRSFIFTYLSNNESSQLGGLKSSLKSKFPDFDERNYGFSKSTSFSKFLTSSFNNDFVIRDNNIEVNSKNEIDKIKVYVVNYISSRGKNATLSSELIHNAIAKRYKSFRVNDYYNNMKEFLKTISEIESDDNGKYHIKKEK